MKRIDLIHPNMSEVKYELTTFPDGEPHIKLGEIDRKDSYKVVCRITSPNELFVVMQVADILDRQCVDWDLIITYLMTQRMDRVINFNEAFSLKIVANVLDWFNWETLGVYSLHSETLKKLISQREVIEMEGCIDTDNLYARTLKGIDTICFPDAGAKYRYQYDFFKFPTICLTKKRDLENKGKILSIEFDSIPETKVSNILIIDDLCDAGGTFVWSAKILKEKYPNAKINIFVRHMVNPVGIKNLSENFNEVYFTNSYKDWENLPENCQMINITDEL